VELPLSFLDNLETSSPGLGESSQGLSGNSHDLKGNSQGLSENSHDLKGSSHDLTKKLDLILASFGLRKVPGKMKQDAMRELIMRLCDESFVKLHDLSKLLGRGQTFIQQHYISPMLSEGLLELKYPNNKNHPNQAYRSKR
jgi:ATP-dependent DNA helicase RecG